MRILHLIAFLLLLLLFSECPDCSCHFENSTPVKTITASELNETLRANREKVVLLNFWATWCRSCIKELDYFSRLGADMEDRGLIVLAISLDQGKENQAKIERIYSGLKGKISPFVLSEPPQNVLRIFDDRWPEVVPSTYIIDRKGRVVEKKYGAIPSLDSIKSLIAPHL